MDTASTVPAAPAAPNPSRHLCPRCGRKKGAATRLLCAGCWEAVPPELSQRWLREIETIQGQSPAVSAILTWAAAAPPAAPAPTPRPARGKPAPVKAPPRCSQCRKPTAKVPRSVLAQLLREILPEGTPKKVRERAELVARRLSGLCEACAQDSAPTLGMDHPQGSAPAPRATEAT